MVTLTAAVGAASPTRAESVTLGVLSVGLASRYTAPDTAMLVGGVRVVIVPSPEMLVPSETNCSTTFPDFAPAVLLSRPTAIDVFAGAPAARPVKLPDAVNPVGAGERTLPFSSSVYGETGAVLLTLICWFATALPIRTLPKLIGCVLLTVGCA